MSNYVVALAVKNEQKLTQLLQRAKKENIKCSYFCEPDLNNQLTAIVLEPGEQGKRLVRHIKLI